MSRRVRFLGLLLLALAACGTEQRTVQTSPGAAPQSVLPSPQLRSESAPPGDIPAPATQQPATSPSPS